MTDIYRLLVEKQVLMPDLSFAVSVLVLLLRIGMRFVWAFLCRKMVRDKGYPDNMNHGFLWGFFLELIGVIVCACKQNYTDPTYMNGMYAQPSYDMQNGSPQHSAMQTPADYSQSYVQPQDHASGQWVCRSCGAYNAYDADFCSQCGAKKE